MKTQWFSKDAWKEVHTRVFRGWWDQRSYTSSEIICWYSSCLCYLTLSLLPPFQTPDYSAHHWLSFLPPKPVSPPAQGEMLLLFSFPCLFKRNTAAPRICLWWGYPRTDLTASLNSFSGGHSTPESSHHFIWNQSLQVHRCQENYAHLHQHVTWPYLSVIFRSTVLPLGFTISEESKPTF